MPTSASSPTQSRSFEALDALRGLAALLVLTRHTPDDTLERWFPGSYLAVDLFFILSGFVLAYAYRERLKRQLSAFDFMKLRYIRLAPLYLLALAVEAVFVFNSAKNTSAIGSSLLFSVFLIPTPSHLSIAAWALIPINWPAWSLFYELIINFVFALSARFLNRATLGSILVVGAFGLVAISFKYGSLDFGPT